jgi:spore germination protein KB
MDKQVVSDKQGTALMVLFIWGSTLIMGTAGEAKKYTWLAIILGMGAASLVIILYCRIINSTSSSNVFDVNEMAFGRIAGSVINILYIFFAYSLGAMVLNNFTEFINIVGLPDSPRIYGIIPIVILSIWGVKYGIEVLGRWAEFFIIILLMIMFTSTTSSIPSMELNRIRPIIPSDIKPVLKGAFSAFSFPFAESVVFMMISSSFQNKKSSYKIYLFGLLISGLFITNFAARNVMIVGSEILSQSYFPSYTALSIIRVGEFVQRIETVVTVSFLLTGFVKISICILAACNGLAKLFRFENYDILVAPVSLTMFATSFIVYDSIMEAGKFTQEVSPYYKIIFQVILPLVTYIGIKVRGKSAKGKTR